MCAGRLCQLERFRFSCSEAVSAMPDVVRALVRQKEAERRCHQLTDLLERAWAERAEEGLEFGECLFDGIEVGAVRRKES